MSEIQLEAAAAILGPLLDEVVFVGGATVHLWLTEPAAPPTRATEDIDVGGRALLPAASIGAIG